MSGSTVIRLGEETYDIDETVNIDLPYSLTFQGMSYGTATIAAATGLTGKPISARCISDCYFKMLSFDATTLTNYGTAAEGCDPFSIGTYNEVMKDCSFDRFYNTILISQLMLKSGFLKLIYQTLWEVVYQFMVPQGLVIVKVAETDFIGCNYGINLSKGSGATIQLASGGYYNANSGDTACYFINRLISLYVYKYIYHRQLIWNNTGKYIEGFDFTRTDGRDANFTRGNAGVVGDKKPSCYLNLLNSSTTTTLTTANSWYKVNWT